MLETNAMFRHAAIGNKNLKQLSDEDICKIQKFLLESLKDIHNICEKNGLKYFLVGGTALGAVRHGGYIPWDEDVDVAMPRKDYDKFCEIALKELSNKYFLQNINTDKKYDLNFLKLRRKGTKYIEIFETEPEKAGLFIDIYPLENVFDNFILRFFHGVLCEFLYLCASCVRVKEKEKIFKDYLSDKKALRTIKIKAFLGKILSFFSLNKWCVLADKCSSKCKNENSSYVSFPSGRKHYFGEMYERKSFFPLKKISFENDEFYIMSNPSVYLTSLYGDWGKIPQKSERERHSIIELDFDAKP